MTNHPNRKRGPYTVAIGGASFAHPATTTVPTIREAKALAESYGTTADWCSVTSSVGAVAAYYRRDASGDGSRWYRAGTE